MRRSEGVSALNVVRRCALASKWRGGLGAGGMFVRVYLNLSEPI